jgi:Fe-S-cluster containining protein
VRNSALEISYPKLRFECLANCALCCSYKVTLSQDDLDRLRRGGHEEEAFYRKEGADRASLRRDAKGCIFLDAGRRCRVHDLRPTYCRLYPFIREIYYRPEVDVDYSCPGIGFGEEIAGEVIAEAVNFPGHEVYARRQSEKVALIEDLLKRRSLFAAERWMPCIAMALIRERKGSGFNIVYPPLAGIGNIIEEEDAHRFLDRISDRVRDKTPDEIFDRLFAEEHFEKRRVNTRLRERGVSRYTLSFIEGSFIVTPEEGAEVTIPFEDHVQLDWQEEALDLLEGYLDIWLGRQLPVRLAHALALSNPFGRNLVYFYLDFLGQVFQRLTVLSTLIAHWRGEERIGQDTLAEAIRGTDNVMRARCMSARVTL